MTGRSELKVDLDDLGDFEPATVKVEPEPEPATKPAKRKKTDERAKEKRRIAAKAYYPSREPDDRTQLNIGVPRALKQRFKELSTSTGLRHYALLEQALDAFEAQDR